MEENLWCNHLPGRVLYNSGQSSHPRRSTQPWWSACQCSLVRRQYVQVYWGMRLHSTLENARKLVFLEYKKWGMRGNWKKRGDKHEVTKFQFLRYHEEKRRVKELYKTIIRLYNSAPPPLPSRMVCIFLSELLNSFSQGSLLNLELLRCLGSSLSFSSICWMPIAHYNLIRKQKTGCLTNIRTSWSVKGDINNRQGRGSLARNHIFFPFLLLGNKKHVFKIFVG